MPGLPNPQPPQIPDHELLRRVGKGAYGEVWLARSVMGTYRAVKIVYRGGFDNDRPFEREYFGLQKFEPFSRSHPGFVHILHVGRNEADGYIFCVMELGDDEATGQTIDPKKYLPLTLARVLEKRGRLPLDECLALCIQLTYGTFRKAGYFIGSGVVEAGCKTVIGQRMKCSGMFWSEEGGQGMLDLRCAFLSDRLDPFCEARAAAHFARNDPLKLVA